MARIVDEGALPEHQIMDLDSEVHHLRVRVAEDRGDFKTLIKEMDTRLRDVEKAVNHIARIVKWGLGIVSAVVGSGIVLLLERGLK